MPPPERTEGRGTEEAFWPGSWAESVPDGTRRVYLGHESCAERIPSSTVVTDAVRRLTDSGKRITLVTPFLTEKEMHRIRGVIEAVHGTAGRFEVVCNDWGLFQLLSESRIAEPVVGRLLVGQATDPRLAAFDFPERQLPHERDVLHADGTWAKLRHRRPTDALMTHLRGCPAAAPEVLSFLQGMGARRLEISNPIQGIRMTPVPGWSVTLHLPEVPLAIARGCWRDGGSRWLHPTFPVPLHQRDNMVFYLNDEIPPNVAELGVDRMVYREA